MATKKKAEESAPKEEARQWMTLAEAAEATRARETDGVLVSFEPSQNKDAHSRHYQLGIVAVRMVSHDGEEMKRIKRDAKRAAMRAANEGRRGKDLITRAEALPAEFQRQWECEVAVASLRGGEGVELHGDFSIALRAGENGEPGEEFAPTDAVQDLFREKLHDAQNWIVSGLYLAGSKIIGDPNSITDQQILSTRKKGSACQLGQALGSLVGGQTGVSGPIAAAISRISGLKI